MKKSPSRKEIGAALRPALIEALDALSMEESGTTLCRTVRALLHVAFDLAEAGEAPRAVMIEQIHRVVRQRLRRLPQGQPVLLMKEGSA